jgi:hypothetical protein
MLNCDPPPGRSTASSVIPLPIALYVSEGPISSSMTEASPGAPFRSAGSGSVPPERNESDADPQSPQPFQRKRQD